MYLLRQQDSIILAAQRNSTKQGLVNINTQRESKLNTIANTRLSLANSMLSQNNSLSGTGDYRTNEKTVNSIYLQTVAVGNNTFSASQLVSLQAIAAQCPLSGGEAVFRARDILTLTQNAPIFYNNVATCGNSFRPAQNRDPEFQNNGFVKINPNPASENSVVQYAFVSEGIERRLLLFNIFGQLVANILLQDLEGEVALSTHALPSGVYHFVVTNTSVKGNLVISH